MPEVSSPVYSIEFRGTDSVSRWATQRQVFGKPLNSQAVIRAKLAAMISRVESAQNWIENITYQMIHMNYRQQAIHLAGYINCSAAENAVNLNGI